MMQVTLKQLSCMGPWTPPPCWTLQKLEPMAKKKSTPTFNLETRVPLWWWLVYDNPVLSYLSFLPYLLLHPIYHLSVSFYFFICKSSWPCKTFSWPCKTPLRICCLYFLVFNWFYIEIHRYRIQSTSFLVFAQPFFSFLVYPSWAVWN